MTNDVDTAETIAEPVAKALQILLRQRVTSAPNVGKEIERIAEKLKKAPKTIQSLIYENRGGFALRVAAVIVAYNLEQSQVSSFFEDLSTHLKKISPVKKSDKKWFGLDEIMPEKEKVDWATAIEVLKKLDYRLEQEDKKK